MNDKLILTEYRDDMHQEIIRLVRLNRYDMKFMQNIFQKYIRQQKPLSPNQNELYEKIIHKYRKQIKKLGVNFKDIINLEWKQGIVPLEELSLQTYFKLLEEDGVVWMNLFFNFNKELIDEVRTLVHDDKGNHLNKGFERQSNFGSGRKYDFTFVKEDKIWRGPFNVYLFRELYYFAKKHNIQIDNSVSTLVSKMSQCGTKKEWKPHLRIVHGRMYVCGIVDTMLPILNEIDMCDLQIQNVERLSRLGLAVPEEYKDIAQYVTAGPINLGHDLTCDEDIELLGKYIKDSGRKCVLFSSSWENNAIYEHTKEWHADIKYYNKTADREEKLDLDKLLELGYNTLITTTPVAHLFFSQEEIGKFALKANKIIYISTMSKK